MPTQAALSGRSERTAILSTHSLYATATNGTNFPLSAYRARLHVPEAYSTAQPSVLLAASPFPRVGCWPTKPQPSILFLLSKAQLYCQLRHADHGVDIRLHLLRDSARHEDESGACPILISQTSPSRTLCMPARITASPSAIVPSRTCASPRGRCV